MKLMIFIGVTVGGIIGGWLGGMPDHGNMLGGWSILLGGVGSIAGVFAGYKIAKSLDME